jgi:hypothetical protein
LSARVRLDRDHSFDPRTTDMRGSLCLSLVAAVATACSSNSGGNGPDSTISVGGTYQTAVTMVSNTCPGQTVEQHSTVVNHSPGATALALVHAGSTYNGTLAADGTFLTSTVTQVFGGISYDISITGEFSETAMDALVTVQAGRQPPCFFTARWAGPKSGDPNVIP